jgi:hypothetical protein
MDAAAELTLRATLSDTIASAGDAESAIEAPCDGAADEAPSSPELAANHTMLASTAPAPTPNHIPRLLRGANTSERIDMTDPASLAGGGPALASLAGGGAALGRVVSTDTGEIGGFVMPEGAGGGSAARSERGGDFPEGAGEPGESSTGVT